MDIKTKYKLLNFLDSIKDSQDFQALILKNRMTELDYDLFISEIDDTAENQTVFSLIELLEQSIPRLSLREQDSILVETLNLVNPDSVENFNSILSRSDIPTNLRVIDTEELHHCIKEVSKVLFESTDLSKAKESLDHVLTELLRINTRTEG